MKTFLKQCKWGQFLLLRGDMICQYVDLYGEWCETEVSLFREVLRNDSNVVEVGANIGMHTIPLSRIASGGRVICFEPQRLIYQMLSANCALNACTNVFAEHLAVGNHTGTITIACSNYEKPWNYGAYSLKDGYDTEGTFGEEQWSEPVGIIRLDDHPIASTVDSLRLLKIDVEGMEVEVLLGAKTLIQRCRPFLFVENNDSRTGDALIQEVAELGYESYWFCSERFSPTNYNGETRKIEGADYNMICFPAEQGVNPGPLTRVQHFADLAEGRVSYAMKDAGPPL